MSRHGRSALPSAWVPLALLHAAAWFAVTVPRGAWSGAWRKMIDGTASSVIIVGPVLASLVALAYSQRRQTALPDLVVSSARPVAGWFGPAARFWFLALASTALVVAEMAVVARAQDVPLLVDPLRVLPYAALVLGAHALVGVAVGRFLAPRFAVPLAGAASFGLFLLAVARLAPASFVTGGVSSSLVGASYRTSALVQLSEVAVFSVVALAALAGPWASTFRAGVATAGAVAAMVLSHQPLDVEHRLVQVPVTLRCAGETPTVCLPSEAPRPLAHAARRMHELIKPLLAARVITPRRWVDYFSDPGDGDGTVAFGDDGDLRSSVPDFDLVDALVNPAACVGFTEAPGAWLDAQSALRHWLWVRNGLPVPLVDQDWRMPSDEWVRTTYAQLRTCDLDAIRLP